MKKTTTLLALAFFLALTPAYLFAQDIGETTETNPMYTDEASPAPRRQMRQDVRDIRQDLKQNVQEKRQAGRQDVMEKRNDVREEIRNRREEMRVEMEQKREEFQEKLGEIRDERKKQVVENIDDRINTMNANRTERLMQHIDKLQDAYARLSERIDELAATGADTTALESALSQAETALGIAESAVAEQASRGYIVELPEEETGLRTAASSTVQQFKEDLRTTYQTVRDAKDALQNVVKTYRSSRSEPTTSSNPTVTEENDVQSPF